LNLKFPNFVIEKKEIADFIMITKEILKKIKLVVFDLDGTLLNDDHEIGESAKRLIPELKAKGIHFSFATGRLHSAVAHLAEELDITTPLISLDGSLIKNRLEGKEVFKSFIPKKNVLKALNLADKYLLKIALCHADAIYFTEDNVLIPQLVDKFGAKFEEVESYSPYLNETLEIVLAGDYKDSIKHVAQRLMFPYSFGLNTTYYKSHRNKDIYYIESRKQGTTKGSGLKKLQAYLNVKMKETIVMGDWYNDRTLFETKALKIAVANAVPEISRLADFITQKTNNEDAAAEVLEMLLKAKQ